MKKLPSVKTVMAIIAITLVCIVTSTKVIEENKKINNSEAIKMNSVLLLNNINTILVDREIKKEESLFVEEQKSETKVEETIVYDGLTFEELANKLNRNLKSTLSGYGETFASFALAYNVDPYLALAIVLHETGCGFGTCSTLASKCNNIGGMRGNRGCGGYAKFATLEIGIEAFFRNLADNYYKKGLTTPQTIGKKYAESSTWASRIEYYINQIKQS